jgi:hypothetical protein
MSRSVKKTPVVANGGLVSEKENKRAAHQAERATARRVLGAAAPEEQDAVMLTARRAAHSSTSRFAKDGKQLVPLRVDYHGRALEILSAPKWANSSRGAHQVVGK